VKIRKEHIWGTVFFVALFGAVWIYQGQKGCQASKDLQVEYPILQMEAELKGVVTSKYNFIANDFRDFGILSMLQIEGVKYGIIAEEVNVADSHGINEIVEVGDSIFKSTNSDIIHIKKNTDNRIYILLRRDEMAPN